MSIFRFLLTFAAVGALLGIILSTLGAPAWIRGDLCGFTDDQKISRPCHDTVSTATTRLVHWQLGGGSAGTVIGLVVGGVWLIRRRRQASSLLAAQGAGAGGVKPPA